MNSVQEQTEITVVKALCRNQDKSLEVEIKDEGQIYRRNQRCGAISPNKRSKDATRGTSDSCLAEAIFAHPLSG
jgi:hypothetical protein